ncbi:MAG TPA: hypothetical protein VFZ32_03580 [Micromonosporaceae bacterium]
MTATLSTGHYPLPSDEDVEFFGLPRAALLILTGTGTGNDAAGWRACVDAAVETVAPSIVRVDRVGPGYVNWGGLRQVRAALLPIVEREAPELLGEEWLDAAWKMAEPYRAREVGVGYLAEAVTFAVTRRISRESHQSAQIIDRAAQALLRLRRSCPPFGGGLTLVIDDLHAWDRPSLRCLYRMVALARPTDRMSVVGFADAMGQPADRDPDDPGSRIPAARHRFFQRMASAQPVRLVAVAPSDPPGAGDDVRGAPAEQPVEADREDVPQRYDLLLLAMGDALVFQNYERVFDLARFALHRAADPDQEAQARRLIAIADAQLDDFGLAAQNLGRAARLTPDSGFAAHLHYLTGLIATKRHYDLDSADAAYQRGLAALGDPGEEEDVARRVERAWLHNGQALVLALRAKAAPDAETRQQSLAAAFDLELRAFSLVRGVPGAAPAYLRHNLMANLTFLLEISGRFDEAVSFWRRAFETYLAGDSREFEVAFDARLGLLLVKAGKVDDGVAVLQQARQVAEQVSDQFGEEELCLKLGYAHTAQGDHRKAYLCYLDALRLGSRLREPDICLDALVGMLWALADAGAREEFTAVCGIVARAVPDSPLAQRLTEATGAELDLAEALTTAGVLRPRPSPKLRAYIPGVDLEGTPTQDLNRYLVWGEGRLPQRPQQTLESDR